MSIRSGPSRRLGFPPPYRRRSDKAIVPPRRGKSPSRPAPSLTLAAGRRIVAWSAVVFFVAVLGLAISRASRSDDSPSEPPAAASAEPVRLAQAPPSALLPQQGPLLASPPAVQPAPQPPAMPVPVLEPPRPALPREEPPPAQAQPKSAPDSTPGGTCGTRVKFLHSPVEASRRAAADQKLLLILHISGNFEDRGFT